MRAVLTTIILVMFCYLSPASLAFTGNSIVINIPSRTLDLYRDGKVYKTFPVGVGRSNFPTPLGTFKVIRMVKNPAWENPYKAVGVARIEAGQSNPLGTRWIGFKEDPKGEYGIHGTDNPESVGKYSSHGCIRMYIKDAEEVFNNISMGTPVIVSYDTARVVIKGSTVLLKTYPDEYKRGQSNINGIKEFISKLPEQVIWNPTAVLKTIKATAPTVDFVKIGTVINAYNFN